MPRCGKLTVVLLLLIAMTFAPGCASYNPKDLKPLSNDALATMCVPLKSTGRLCSDDVKVYASILSSARTKFYFDRDICAKGYVIVQFTIANNSDSALVLDNSSIGVQTTSFSDISKLVGTSTCGRASAYGVGALLFFPLIIPAVVDGVRSSEANQRLAADLSMRCADICYIHPHSLKNHVIFVHRSAFRNEFEMTLVDNENQSSIIYGVKV